MTLAYEKGIMNIQNRRQRRCVIGKVIPHFSEPMFKHEPVIVSMRIPAAEIDKFVDDLDAAVATTHDLYFRD